MTAFLYLQRFDRGAPTTMPFQPLIEVLSRYGQAGRGRGDVELTLEPDTIASGCTVVGDPAAGASCAGFERPLFDADLRKLVWECMTQFGCTVFDDSLDTVYAHPEGIAALPADFVAASSNGVRRVSSAQQLWPEMLEQPLDAPARPALCYPNANANGPHFQMFDFAEFDKKHLYVELNIRPEACNPGTLRVLRNLELRVDAALCSNPEYGVFYRYVHHESPLRVLESPRLGELAKGATIVSPMPGEAPRLPGFVADREVFASQLAQSEELARHAQEKYQITLDGSVASVDRLAGVLDKLHAFYCQERKRQPAGQPISVPVATSWAVKAGGYLGTVIRQRIGAQWGYVSRGQRRLPVVRTHRGRVCHPHLMVLDHIINGPGDSIVHQFNQLLQYEVSATPRHQDIVCNIPVYCQILLGASRFSNGELPLEARIPRDQLDFSIDSLRHLDSYLAEVSRQVADFSAEALANLKLAAGAYLGEVICSNAARRGSWRWVTYDDHARENPDFANSRPRDFPFMAILDSDEQTTYPLAYITALLAGGEAPPTQAYVRQLVGAPADPAGNAGQRPSTSDAWPADRVMAEALDGTRSAIADWRRMAKRPDYNAICAAGPDWLVWDSLREILDRQLLLLEQGTVVWGSLVQANSALFEPGPDDLPAALVYSHDAHFDSRPQNLRQIGGELFAHKGHDAPEPLRRIAEWLADEVERAYDIPVPDLLTERQVLITTFVVFRRHLPENVLNGAWFPILTHPDTRALMIVPRQFWPQNLIALWKARELLA